MATHLLQSGMSMEYVRDFLGHKCLESTQIYARPGSHQLQAL
ncbi:tyrosine-type recombinase/integrase [Chitinophaga ginsengisegetis]